MLHYAKTSLKSITLFEAEFLVKPISSIIFKKKYIKYNILNRDKPGLTTKGTGTTDKNKTVLPPVFGQRISLITCALIN